MEEERAPGGERKLTPKQWFLLAAVPSAASTLDFLRVKRLPDEPMTRFEYLEKLAFIPKEDEHGDL